MLYYLLGGQGKSGELCLCALHRKNLKITRRGNKHRRNFKVTQQSNACVPFTDKRGLGEELACLFHLDDFFPELRERSPKTLDAMGCTIQITNVDGLSEHCACMLSISAKDPHIRSMTLVNQRATSMVDSRVHGPRLRVFGPALFARYDSVKTAIEIEHQYLPLTGETLKFLQLKFALTLGSSAQDTPSHGGKRREQPCPERITLDQHRARLVGAGAGRVPRDGPTAPNGSLVADASSKGHGAVMVNPPGTPATDVGSQSDGFWDQLDRASDASEDVVFDGALLLEDVLLNHGEVVRRPEPPEVPPPPPPPPPRPRPQCPRWARP